MSTKTGCAPHSSITFAVDSQEYAGTSTISPGRTSRANSAKCKAAVPLLTATAYWQQTYCATACSKAATCGPCTKWPEASTSRTACKSSSAMLGIVSRITAADPDSTQPCGECLLPDLFALRTAIAHVPCVLTGRATPHRRSLCG